MVCEQDASISLTDYDYHLGIEDIKYNGTDGAYGTEISQEYSLHRRYAIHQHAFNTSPTKEGPEGTA